MYVKFNDHNPKPKEYNTNDEFCIRLGGMIDI